MLTRARLCALLWGLTAAALCWAQAPVGSMNGIVKDPTEAVMPGVGITVTNKDNGAERKVVTGADGSYAATPLSPGSYAVKAEAEGFRTLEVNATVQVGQIATVDLVMQVGATGEVVNVRAEGAQ